MIIRLVLLFVIVAILLWLVKRLFNSDTTSTEDEQPVKAKGENMVQCKYCGIHAPESSIITQGSNRYCSQDHAERDQQ